MHFVGDGMGDWLVRASRILIDDFGNETEIGKNKYYVNDANKEGGPTLFYPWWGRIRPII